LGAALNNSFQYYGALPHLEEAVRLKAPTAKERANAYNALGKARFRRGDFDGAIACFFQATLDAPEWDDPFMNAGLTLLIIGDPQRALNHLNRAVALGNSSQQVLDAIKRAQEALSAGPTGQGEGRSP
jgi:tetratricopeptide (TPR) repeat protein